MIRALGKRVVIKPDEKSETNDYGLKLPSDNVKKQKPQKGSVISFGEEVSLIASIKEGDRVTYAQHSGISITDDEGIPYLVMNYSDILAKI